MSLFRHPLNHFLMHALRSRVAILVGQAEQIALAVEIGVIDSPGIDAEATDAVTIACDGLLQAL